MNKDRFSALLYVIFYIMEFENNFSEEQDDAQLLQEYTFL